MNNFIFSIPDIFYVYIKPLTKLYIIPNIIMLYRREKSKIIILLVSYNVYTVIIL